VKDTPKNEGINLDAEDIPRCVPKNKSIFDMVMTWKKEITPTNSEKALPVKYLPNPAVFAHSNLKI
jgi:hypothetical protein